MICFVFFYMIGFVFSISATGNVLLSNSEINGIIVFYIFFMYHIMYNCVLESDNPKSIRKRKRKRPTLKRDVETSNTGMSLRNRTLKDPHQK